jgi:23S rRNA pseudouridine955/2504/2580 synthase
VDTDSAGQRLDNFLLRLMKGVPRSHVYRLIRSGQVRVNSGRVRPSHRLRAGDRVRLPPLSRPLARQARARPGGLAWLEQRVVFEDDSILVLDKPAGLAVHGGSGIDVGCVEAMRSLRPHLPQLELVHRLDRATSGCLLLAKRRSTLRRLHRLLREGGIEKRYLALLKGDWQLGTLVADFALSRAQRGGEAVVVVDANGKPARTRFRLVERFGGFASLVEASLLTGRTHQIRVHAAHLGHPIAGDERYGDPEFDRMLEPLGLRRMFLHAHLLSFTWPDSERVIAVSAPLPAELGTVLDALKAAERRE